MKKLDAGCVSDSCIRCRMSLGSPVSAVKRPQGTPKLMVQELLKQDVQ